MALNLDTRQRAMLQEMGITVWMPKPVATAPAPAAVMPSAAAPAVLEAHAAAAAAGAVASASITAAPANTKPMAVEHTVERAAPPAAAPSVPSAQAVTLPQAPAADMAAWRIAPAVQAFPDATGGHADDAWLVIWECATPATPLEGDSGKLLGNMLRALRLHHSPHVWIAGMQRPGQDSLAVAGLPAQSVPWQDAQTGVAQTVAQTQPARILLLGMHAARAVLGRQDALGLLRAQVHQLHGRPTVVSYDPAYLLRSPHAKPAAWADLCRAHALRPPSRNQS